MNELAPKLTLSLALDPDNGSPAMQMVGIKRELVAKLTKMTEEGTIKGWRLIPQQ